MVTNIFVNLPVKDLKKSMEFFKHLGFTFNEQFTDDTAAAMVIGKNMYAMLLTESKFKEFISTEVADTNKVIEVLVALSLESKQEVDDLFEKVLQAGGRQARPAKDHGFMYERSFKDVDGHIWEPFWMDPSFVK